MKLVKLTWVTADPGSSAVSLITARFSRRFTRRKEEYLPPGQRSVSGEPTSSRDLPHSRYWARNTGHDHQDRMTCTCRQRTSRWKLSSFGLRSGGCLNAPVEMPILYGSFASDGAVRDITGRAYATADTADRPLRADLQTYLCQRHEKNTTDSKYDSYS